MKDSKLTYSEHSTNLILP